jgi:proline dehydrogenase
MTRWRPAFRSNASASPRCTPLGENLTSVAEADAIMAHYIEVIDRIKASGMQGEISVKPTQLGLDLTPTSACARHAGPPCRRRRPVSGSMESTPTRSPRSSCTSASAVARTICLRAYLRRSAAVSSAAALDPAIRLVKGAYDEPESAAFRDKRAVDAAFVGLAIRFLLDGRGRPIQLGLGTHDVGLIEQIAEQAGQAGVGRDAYEVQMLYGIREDQQKRLRKEGYKVRSLIAYGDFWYPWYMRRLAERPANVWFALRQMLP